MKKILLILAVFILSVNIYAQKTDFRPRKSYSGVNSDVTSSWWDVYIKKLNPDILFDYFGDEEFNGGWETGYVVLKKGNKKVILFNTYLGFDTPSGEEDKGTTYVIYDAKISPNSTDFYFNQNLSWLLYNLDSKNIGKVLAKIHQQFGGKIVKLKTTDFEKYFL